MWVKGKRTLKGTNLEQLQNKITLKLELEKEAPKLKQRNKKSQTKELNQVIKIKKIQNFELKSRFENKKNKRDYLHHKQDWYEG